MTPKDKKPKKKAPAFATGEKDLEQWGVQAGQLVRNKLGCTGTVLGVKASATPGAEPQLWVRWAGGGLEAPVEAGAGVEPLSGAEQLRLDIAARQREAAALEAKWKAYNDEQARKAAEAAKAAAKRKKKAPPPADAAGGEA